MTSEQPNSSLPLLRWGVASRRKSKSLGILTGSTTSVASLSTKLTLSAESTHRHGSAAAPRSNGGKTCLAKGKPMNFTSSEGPRGCKVLIGRTSSPWKLSVPNCGGESRRPQRRPWNTTMMSTWTPSSGVTKPPSRWRKHRKNFSWYANRLLVHNRALWQRWSKRRWRKTQHCASFSKVLRGSAANASPTETKRTRLPRRSVV
mmetsp:Transcript_53907/g.165878  ORF Transcript_53907/g.165878 Transcript_53907/m.165878 type:complete len:203 (+) Transcript_53907:415-1023(+)